jgi:hypothetical protein
MLIDITKLPSWRVTLSKLNTASQIKRLMKLKGITDYCYSFIIVTPIGDIIMKYGQSGDNDWQRGSYGERIYRQAFHIPGWPTQPSPNSAGKDMLDIIQHFPGIHKDTVCIQVWDMTNYPFAVASDHRHELTILENQLISAHITSHGTMPIGNIKSENHITQKTRVTDEVFNNVFEFV